jgi:hypothetical protein
MWPGDHRPGEDDLAVHVPLKGFHQRRPVGTAEFLDHRPGPLEELVRLPRLDQPDGADDHSSRHDAQGQLAPRRGRRHAAGDRRDRLSRDVDRDSGGELDARVLDLVRGGVGHLQPGGEAEAGRVGQVGVFAQEEAAADGYRELGGGQVHGVAEGEGLDPGVTERPVRGHVHDVRPR